MSSHPSLKHTLTELYLSTPSYSVSEVLDILRSLDFFALEDAVKERMELVFAYVTKSWLPRRYNLSTDSLFGQKATLLLSDPPIICDLDSTGAVICSRGLELWLKEDMSFAVIAHHSTVCRNGMFTSDYRAIKDVLPWKCGMRIDLRMLTDLLRSMYAPVPTTDQSCDDKPYDYIFPCNFLEEIDLGE